MKNFKELLKNRRVVGTICAVAAVAVIGVGFYVNRGPEFPVHVDPIHEEKSDLVTPLSDGTSTGGTQAPTVETKTSTKTENKTVKLAKASTRTFTKNLGTKSSTKTKKSTTKDAEVVTVDKTDITKKESYTEGSKTKKVSTTTTLTRTITTTKKTAGGSEGTKGTSGGSGNGNGKSTGDIYAVATGMDTRVLSAFEALNCKVVIDPNFSGGNGQFDPNTGILTLQEEDRGDALHELGHFVAFITGVSKKAPSAELKKVYADERGKFPGTFVKYATSTPDEFFAECMREYYLGGSNQAALKNSCPATAKLIEESVASINSSLLGSARKYKN